MKCGHSGQDFGLLESWNCEILESWNSGILELWNRKIVESWNFWNQFPVTVFIERHLNGFWQPSGLVLQRGLKFFHLLFLSMYLGIQAHKSGLSLISST